MKKFLFSNPTHSTPASLSLLIQRLIFGFFMLFGHGWGKLVNFTDRMDSFPDPLGVGSPLSLGLAVFAEVFCAFLVGIGLLTRAALIPLIITMAVAAFMVHGGDPLFGRGPSKEMALLFMAAYVSIFVAGPGKFSVDHLLK
jgi:putative oxidoreductase